MLSSLHPIYHDLVDAQKRCVACYHCFSFVFFFHNDFSNPHRSASTFWQNNACIFVSGAVLYTCIIVQDNNNDTRIQEIRFNNHIFTICHPRLSHFPNHQFNTRISTHILSWVVACRLSLSISIFVSRCVQRQRQRSAHGTYQINTPCGQIKSLYRAQLILHNILALISNENKVIISPHPGINHYYQKYIVDRRISKIKKKMKINTVRLI